MKIAPPAHPKAAQSSLAFRAFLACIALGFALLGGWLATHQSATPEILGRYSRGYFLMVVGLLALAAMVLALQLPAAYRRLHPHRREIVLLTMSVPASLALCEGAVRALDLAGISYFEAGTRYELDKVADPVLVYRHPPGLRRNYQGVDVTTNEIGLRERPIAPRREGELRVLLVGDSVVFGWGVAFESTLGQRLEARLGEELKRPVTVLNSGVGSYNTMQELGFLKQRVAAIQPDAAVLIYVGNDIEPRDPPFDPWSQLQWSGKSPPEKLTLLLQKSWTWRLALFSMRRFHAKEGARFDRNSRGVKESMQALVDMANLCRERGIAFQVVFYRRPDEDSSALLNEIRTTGERAGFPVVDAKPWWGEVDLRSVTNSVVDTHPNARGYDLLSVGLTRHLLSEGFGAIGRR